MEKIETSRDLEETKPDQTSETGLSLRILYPLLKTSFKCLQLLSWLTVLCFCVCWCLFPVLLVAAIPNRSWALAFGILPACVVAYPLKLRRIWMPIATARRPIRFVWVAETLQFSSVFIMHQPQKKSEKINNENCISFQLKWRVINIPFGMVSLWRTGCCYSDSVTINKFKLKCRHGVPYASWQSNDKLNGENHVSPLNPANKGDDKRLWDEIWSYSVVPRLWSAS